MNHGSTLPMDLRVILMLDEARNIQVSTSDVCQEQRHPTEVCPATGFLNGGGLGILGISSLDCSIWG